MPHLRTTELDTDSDFIAFSQKLLNLARLYIYIMFVCTRTQTNLFLIHRLLILTRLVLFLCLLVLIAAIVHQFADWRHGIGRYLDQIKIPLMSDIKRT